MKQHDRGSVLHAKFSQDRHNSVSQYVKTIKAPEVPNIFDREILPFQKVVDMGHIKNSMTHCTQLSQQNAVHDQQSVSH